jgi:hypothetical protein
VLLSHHHDDHLDRPSVRDVAQQAGRAPCYVVPRGFEDWFARNLPRRDGALPERTWGLSMPPPSPSGPTNPLVHAAAAPEPRGRGAGDAR